MDSQHTGGSWGLFDVQSRGSMPRTRRKTTQKTAAVVVATGLPWSLFEEFHALAMSQGISRATLLRRLVRAALGHQPVAVRQQMDPVVER